MRLKTVIWALAVLAGCHAVRGMDRMSALSMIESGDNDQAVGRAGEVSRFQVDHELWRIIGGTADYTNPAIARAVALNIVNDRIARFRRKFGRLPDDFEFYVLWNAPGQAMYGEISPAVRDRAQRFENLCNSTTTQK